MGPLVVRRQALKLPQYRNLSSVLRYHQLRRKAYPQITQISQIKIGVRKCYSWPVRSTSFLICEANLQVLVFVARFPVASSETIQPAAKRRHLVAPCVSAG